MGFAVRIFCPFSLWLMNLIQGKDQATCWQGGVYDTHCVSSSASAQPAVDFYYFNLTSNVNTKLILQTDTMNLQLQEAFVGKQVLQRRKKVENYRGILFFIHPSPAQGLPKKQREKYWVSQKGLFRFFNNILQKNPNKLLGQLIEICY